MRKYKITNIKEAIYVTVPIDLEYSRTIVLQPFGSINIEVPDGVDICNHIENINVLKEQQYITIDEELLVERSFNNV